MFAHDELQTDVEVICRVKAEPNHQYDNRDGQDSETCKTFLKPDQD